ncbi:DNA-binding protein [Actinacidiphila glaucinigra]|uniref:DNA-binding protein n=1 Tax=Actinacidiphila glaucinigra TaxID=235986 RepID=UPI003712555E
MQYRPGWQRVCERHQRWLLNAGDSDGLEHLDLRQCPDIAAAQRRWAAVTRRAAQAGAGPERVFAVARAVVCAWWEQALHWEKEQIWPARLHRVAGGDAGGDFWRWRAVVRDAVVFPEAVTVADALLDPAMAELAWRDSGAEHPQLLPVDGAFCRELGMRVGRPWLGPLAAVDYGGPLLAWMGAIIRRRRNMTPGGYADDPWRVKHEHRPVTAAAQLRTLAQNTAAGGSGTTWRSAVPAEQRAMITALVGEATEHLTELRGAHSGTARDASRHLLQTLTRTTSLLQQALQETTAAALQAGIPLGDLTEWTGQPTATLERSLADDRRTG